MGAPFSVREEGSLSGNSLIEIHTVYDVGEISAESYYSVALQASALGNTPKLSLIGPPGGERRPQQHYGAREEVQGSCHFVGTQVLWTVNPIPGQVFRRRTSLFPISVRSQLTSP